MKNKILSVIMAIGIFFTSSISSFANPIVSVPSISYELLMGLMGIGVAFGVALPKTDEEYYDYTQSLRSHLRLVDEDYLKELDEHFKKNKNNDKKFQVPYVPGILEKLFENVGKEVSSPKVSTYSGTLGNIPIFKTSNLANSKGISIELGEAVGYSYVNSKGNSVVGSIRIYQEGDKYYSHRKFETSDGKKSDIKSVFNVSLLTKYKVKLCLVGEQGKDIFPMYYLVNSSGNFYSSLFSEFASGSGIKMEDFYVNMWPNTQPDGVIRDKTEIEYKPTFPNINTENGTVTIPSIPNIPIPDSGKLPNIPPLEVQDPIPDSAPSPEPSPDPNPNPGEGEGEGEGNGGSNFPSFPNFGEDLDFSPLYLSNLKDKFPFSLPWDIKRILEQFDVEPIAPKFEFPIQGEKLVIDLSQFNEWANIVRFFVNITFIVSLIFITTKLKS